jgi:hypothetical protein
VTTPEGRREPVLRQAFELRIPLFNRLDAFLVLPSRWIYEDDWQQLMAVLEAMKPTLVISDQGEEA